MSSGAPGGGALRRSDLADSNAAGCGTTIEEAEPVSLRCSMVVLRGDSVLLCRRGNSRDNAGSWVLPGGNPRRGEGTAVAAAREVREETGISSDVERVLFVLETTSWDHDHHMVEVVFVGTERGEAIEPAAEEEDIFPSFVPVDDLPRLNMRPPIAGYVRGYARNRGYANDPRWSTAAYLGNVWRAGDATDESSDAS